MENSHMRKLVMAVTLSIPLLAASSRAQQVCPCVPISYEWIPMACDSWQCVETEVALANGLTLIPIPTNNSDFHWVVLKRIASGGAIVSPDAPFKVDGFDLFADGVAKYSAMSSDVQPLLITAPDGKTLVVSRPPGGKQRNRAVGH
jgi:hypothetical protein